MVSSLGSASAELPSRSGLSARHALDALSSLSGFSGPTPESVPVVLIGVPGARESGVDDCGPADAPLGRVPIGAGRVMAPNGGPARAPMGSSEDRRL